MGKGFDYWAVFVVVVSIQVSLRPDSTDSIYKVRAPNDSEVDAMTRGTQETPR